MEEFLEQMADILEVAKDSISLKTDYREDVPYWDSMLGFSTLVMIEEKFSVVISVDDFIATKTLGDLWDKIQEEK